ncbi:hypothetical protein [Scytonema sp. PRP1]|uniref:hypothetical protein n=1 Tax=Scytonema sp. PRP1 TaxID=3120513 RepID=UPI002FD0AE98
MAAFLSLANAGYLRYLKKFLLVLVGWACRPSVFLGGRLYFWADKMSTPQQA